MGAWLNRVHVYNLEKNREASFTSSLFFLFLLILSLKEMDCVGLEGDGGNKQRSRPDLLLWLQVGKFLLKNKIRRWESLSDQWNIHTGLWIRLYSYFSATTRPWQGRWQVIKKWTVDGQKWSVAAERIDLRHEVRENVCLIVCATLINPD